MSERSWTAAAERGGVVGIQILVFLATVFGRAPARAVLRLIALYYVLFSATVRRVSRAYLERVRAGPAGFWDVYRHVLCFCRVTLDRLFFARGLSGQFSVGFNGEEHLEKLRAEGRGAVLIGAHLGSYEAGRTMSAARAFKLNLLGYFRNAAMLNATLERLNPGVNARVIHIEPGKIDFLLEAQERLEAGEMVAVMADRVMPGGKSVEASFLGAAARFPTGPFQLAGALGCPVYLFFGLYREPNRYELYCEPFAERIELPRRARDEAVAPWVRRYAERLEHYCRMAPENWFNFFDFWNTGAEQ